MPPNATPPITFTWSPVPDWGQGSPGVLYSWPMSGTYTITVTAENCGGSVVDTHAIDIRSEITMTIDPGMSSTLVYIDPRGMTTTIEVPTGAVTEATVLVFAPRYTSSYPISPGLGFAHHIFDLEAYRNGSLLPGFSFLEPVAITIRYSDGDVTGIDEDTLRLYYWTGSGWADAIDTCDPPSGYTRDPAGNVLGVSVCHLTEWGMIGSAYNYQIYLPLIQRPAP
jgi:hypothetical protein